MVARVWFVCCQSVVYLEYMTARLFRVLLNNLGGFNIARLQPFVTVYGKTRHNAACVNIEKSSIDFLKMYCFKPTEGNG